MVLGDMALPSPPPALALRQYVRRLPLMRNDLQSLFSLLLPRRGWWTARSSNQRSLRYLRLKQAQFSHWRILLHSTSILLHVSPFLPIIPYLPRSDEVDHQRISLPLLPSHQTFDEPR